MYIMSIITNKKTVLFITITSVTRNMEAFMKKSVKKIGIGVVAIVAVATTAVLLSQDKVMDFHEKYEGENLTADIVGMEREGTYTNYLAAHAQAAYPQTSVDVQLMDYVMGKGVEVYHSYEGEENVLYTDSESSVTWQVEVPESGFYNLYMEYLINLRNLLSQQKSV